MTAKYDEATNEARKQQVMDTHRQLAEHNCWKVKASRTDPDGRIYSITHGELHVRYSKAGLVTSVALITPDRIFQPTVNKREAVEDILGLDMKMLRTSVFMVPAASK